MTIYRDMHGIDPGHASIGGRCGRDGRGILGSKNCRRLDILLCNIAKSRNYCCNRFSGYNTQTTMNNCQGDSNVFCE